MDGNKWRTGLKNVHYALVTDDGNGNISYGTPTPIRGAISLSIKPKIEVTDIAADDEPAYDSVEDNQGYEGDIEFLQIPDSFKTEVLGDTIDGNGVLIENKDGKTKRIALLFEFDGDNNKTRHILYNCRVTRPSVDGKTKGEKVETQNDTLSLVAYPAKDTGNIKAKCAYGDTAYDGWYSAVYLTTAGTRVTPDDVVFDKKTANRQDAIITILPAASETLSTIKKGSTALTTTTHYTVSTNVVTIKKEYLATLSVGKHNLTFTFSNGNKAVLEVTVIDTTA